MPREKEAAPRAAVESREVKRGDTLAKIAGEAKPEGVSLDQMLVALFRGNKDAFDGANMNRLRAGKILSIPSAEAVAAVAPAEARKIVVAQAGDFNAYRRKLAGAVAGGEAAKEEAPKQEAAGKITPKVEEKAPPVPAGKDKLAVSRTESAKEAKAAGRITALEEDLVARDKALKEAGSRIADLEKNLNDLKKLAEMKSQAGAQMQQQAQAAKAPEIKQPEAKPAPVPAPAAVPAPEGKPAEAKPAETKAPEAAVEKPAEPAKPAEAPKPPRKPLPPPPPPPPPPSFLEENGLLVMGGGVVLLGLAGFLGYSAWRRKKKASDLGATSRITEGDLTANSVFGTTGGQSVDTSSNVSLQTDFSQSSMSAIDADEGVDPVAEADVYMAYGRDAQAEEILVDALKTDPKRLAIHLKLLEIYAGRKNAKQFESVAKELHGLTNGSGPDWEKAAALGRTVDAANPLYGGLPGAEAPAAPGMAELAATTIIVPPTEAAKLSETVTMPGQLAQIAAAAEAAPQPVAPEALDFDLDLGAPAAAPQAAPQPMAAPAEEISSLDFDLDLGGAAAVPAPAAPQASHLDVELEMPPAVPAAPVAVEPATLDFDLDLGTPAAAPAPAAPAPEATPAMDFDFDLGSLGAEAPAPVPEAGAAPALDLSAISLDLGAPPAPAPAAAAPVGDENPEVATKLELAQAYEEMGDKEGARELLQEVLNEGSPAQREAARQKLASLA